MSVEVTPRAAEVFRRALEAGRMDPERVGIRVSIGRGLRGEEARTGFAEDAEEDERTVTIDAIRLFVPIALFEEGATIDVADEHDRIVIRRAPG
jgi:hypothetical protein